MGHFAIKYSFGHPELGQSPQTGFDCSGFCRFVLAESGLVVPDYLDLSNNRRAIRHTNEFWDYYGVAVHPGLHQRGDLVFFSRCGSFPTHMGILLDEETYIHSPGKNNSVVCESAITVEPIEPHDNNARQTFSVNPIGYKSPVSPIEHSYRHVKAPI